MCSLLPVYLYPSIFHYPANSLFRADGVESGEAWGRAIAQHSYATGHSSKGPTRGHLWLQKPEKGHFLAHLSQLFFFTTVMLASGLELSVWSKKVEEIVGFKGKGLSCIQASLRPLFCPPFLLLSVEKGCFYPPCPAGWKWEREEEGAWQGRESLPPSLPYTQNMAQDAIKTSARI